MLVISFCKSSIHEVHDEILMRKFGIKDEEAFQVDHLMSYLDTNSSAVRGYIFSFYVMFIVVRLLCGLCNIYLDFVSPPASGVWNTMRLQIHPIFRR